MLSWARRQMQDAGRACGLFAWIAYQRWKIEARNSCIPSGAAPAYLVRMTQQAGDRMHAVLV